MSDHTQQLGKVARIIFGKRSEIVKAMQLHVGA